MVDTNLEDRLAQYGGALDEARRAGSPRRVSVARRVAPVVAFAAAIALLVTALVVIPDSGKRRTLPADLPAAEAAIRRAFETLLDRSLPVDERRAATETLRDPAAQARAIERWNALLSVTALEGASVQRIELVDASTADVDLGFQPPGVQGNVVPARAVARDGKWRVAYATACAFGSVIRPACAPDDFLTAEEQAIGQPFVDIAWSELPDDTRVREIQGGAEIRSQVLDAVNRHRNMLGERTEILAVRHRRGEKSAKVWWTVGTVQPGVALLDGDHWTVSRDTWCKLSQNAGEHPPVCGETASTTTTTTPLNPELPRRLDVELGTEFLWPAAGRLSDSSGAVGEAAKRFFVAIGIPDATIALPPDVGAAPTWVRATVGLTRIPVLLAPTKGVWAVVAVGGVFRTLSDGQTMRYDGVEAGDDVELAWRDASGMHGTHRAAERPYFFDFGPVSGDLASALVVKRTGDGSVRSVDGSVYAARAPVISSRPCGASDVEVQGVTPTPDPNGEGGPGLFIRIFNISEFACHAAGLPGIELRRNGTWVPFDEVRGQGGTSGPEWTGTFTPDLVGVFSIAGAAGDGAVAYDALRVVLPNGEKVDFTGIDFRVVGTTLKVSPWSADSQDV